MYLLRSQAGTSSFEGELLHPWEINACPMSSMDYAGSGRQVIAAWETAIPKLLEDPQYKKLYTDNNLQPGFIPHAEYVKFMDDFGKETESFLKGAGVIK